MGSAAACWKLQEIGSQVWEVCDKNRISNGIQERLGDLLRCLGG